MSLNESNYEDILPIQNQFENGFIKSKKNKISDREIVNFRDDDFNFHSQRDEIPSKSKGGAIQEDIDNITDVSHLKNNNEKEEKNKFIKQIINEKTTSSDNSPHLISKSKKFFKKIKLNLATEMKMNC